MSQPTGPADYHILLDAQKEESGAFFFEDRWVDCSIIGKGEDGKVVTITDSKTGLTVPYQLYIEDIRIPHEVIYDLPIINKDRAASTIEVVCTALLYAGDAILLEATMADVNVPAPLLTSVEFFEIPRDVDPSRLYAGIVTATINAAA